MLLIKLASQHYRFPTAFMCTESGVRGHPIVQSRGLLLFLQDFLRDSGWQIMCRPCSMCMLICA